MFCSQCGLQLPDNARFCPNCGAASANTPTPQASPSTVASAGNTVKQLDTRKIGQLYCGLINLSTRQVREFIDNITPKYKGLYRFIQDAETDIQQIFSQINLYFFNFLQENHVYQYSERQVQAHTQPYIGNWIEVFNVALEAYQNITGEEQQMRQYRDVRKASRGRVVGGGFTFSGAAKGMATAGAINMTTGMLHSLANAWGNSKSAAEADSKKRAFFQNMDFRDELEKAIRTDCYNMLEGFLDLWNPLNLGYIPYYTSETFEQAVSIESAVYNNRVPMNQIKPSLLKMLELYPVSPSLYWAATELLPSEQNTFFSMALDYGMDLRASQKKLQSAAQIYAEKLVSNRLFCENYSILDEDLMETLDSIADVYEDLISKSFVVFNPAYKDRYSGKLQAVRNAFAPYPNSEIPLMVYTSAAFGGNDKGILITDKKLYVHGSGYKEPARCYPLDTVQKIQLSSEGELLYFTVNGEANVQTYSTNDNETILDIMNFLCSYCLFIQNDVDARYDEFVDDVLKYTNLSPDDLDERVFDDGFYDDSYDDTPDAAVKYCSECGAENDEDADFCTECGAKLL